ncbi:MAG: metallophosphoesterase [Verrucomicrobiia bacterium]
MISRRHFLTLGTSGLTGALLGCARSSGLLPLNFLFFTDVHAIPDRGVPEALGFLASRINALRPDLVIGGGDFIHRGLSSTPDQAAPRFTIFTEFLKKLHFPVQPILGNHDLIGLPPSGISATDWNPRRPAMEALGLDTTYRTFEHPKGYKFFLLDSIDLLPAEDGTLSYRGHISDQQIAWLADQLRQTDREQPLILVTHIPFRTTFRQITENPLAPLPPFLAVDNANHILRLFDQHNLLLILQGHLHYSEAIQINRTTFLMGGAVCGRWWHGPNLGTPEGLAAIGMDPKFVEHRYQNYGWSAPVTPSDQPWANL